MIDTWLFAALCLSFLSICAFLRAIPRSSRFDRIIAIHTGIILTASAALLLCIALGSILILDAAIVATLSIYSGVIAVTSIHGGELG